MEIVYENISMNLKEVQKDEMHYIQFFFEKNGIMFVFYFNAKEKYWILSIDRNNWEDVFSKTDIPLLQWLKRTYDNQPLENKFGDFLVKESPLRVQLLTQFGPHQFNITPIKFGAIQEKFEFDNFLGNRHFYSKVNDETQLIIMVKREYWRYYIQTPLKIESFSLKGNQFHSFLENYSPEEKKNINKLFHPFLREIKQNKKEYPGIEDMLDPELVEIWKSL